MEWYLAWLNATVMACGYPLMIVAGIFGASSTGLAGAVHALVHPPAGDGAEGFELIMYFYQFILFSIMGTMAFMAWPVMTVMMYFGDIINITEGQRGNIGFMGLVGFGTGLWATLKLLPMVDEYFGIEPSQGLSWAVRAWCFAGQVYGAVKVAKVGREIIRKI